MADEYEFIFDDSEYVPDNKLFEIQDSNGNKYVFSNILYEPKLNIKDITERQQLLKKIGFDEYLNRFIKAHTKNYLQYCYCCYEYYNEYENYNPNISIISDFKNYNYIHHFTTKKHKLNHHYYKICMEC
jgi:hypothetical protein